MIKTSNKMHKPKAYDEAINDPIYKNRQFQAIDKELQNLKLYQVLYYKKLLFEKKSHWIEIGL